MNTFDLTKPIVIGADHAGYEYKEKIKEFLSKQHISFKDFGTDGIDSVDYPDFAHPVAIEVEHKNASLGILICGSANGVAITANKHSGIRAAICWNTEIAVLARKHNNANIICIPARFVTPAEAENMIAVFLKTAFEGGRHQNRISKIPC